LGLPTVNFTWWHDRDFKITKHKYDYKVAPELIYNINKVTREMILDCQKTEVIMIL